MARCRTASTTRRSGRGAASRNPSPPTPPLRIRLEAHERYSEHRQDDWYPRYVAQLDPVPGSSVLDVGCGIGAFHPALAAAGARVLAFDYSPGMAREARQRAARDGLPVQVLQADTQQIPLAANSVDHALAYEEDGQGAPTILQVHCWTCDHSFLAPQFRHLLANHRVVNVDLRGHGERDRPKQAYTVAGFADDLAWLCEQLGVESAVFVGHSMGGNVALEVARRYPDLARAVVMIDSCIIAPEGLKPTLTSIGEALRGPDHREVPKQVIEGVSLPTDDACRKAWMGKVMSAVPQFVASSAFDEHLLKWDGEAAAAACKVPALYIGAANPLSDLDRLRAACPQLVVGQTVGAGHFNNQEVPEQVNAMIDRFLTMAVPA